MSTTPNPTDLVAAIETHLAVIDAEQRALRTLLGDLRQIHVRETVGDYLARTRSPPN
ncbi:MAG: hypothetical protein V9F00_08835 [Nocardioides sp.]